MLDMNIATLRPWLTLPRIALGIPLLLASCVKQSDYEILLKQKQELEGQVQIANQQVVQEQAATKAVQARMLHLINIQSALQKREEELQAAKAELEALKAEFDKFRTQRRSAMSGKKYPMLTLDSGKVLTNVDVVSVDSTHFSLRHDGGYMKIPIAESSDELRWEICYDAEEAKRTERSRFLTEARLMDEKLAKDRLNPKKPQSGKERSTFGPSSAEKQARAAVTSLRAQLNLEYQALKNKNPSAMKNMSWRSDRPEASDIFTSLGARPVIMGFSRLESLRDAINSHLATLQSMGAKF